MLKGTVGTTGGVHLSWVDSGREKMESPPRLVLRTTNIVSVWKEWSLPKHLEFRYGDENVLTPNPTRPISQPLLIVF